MREQGIMLSTSLSCWRWSIQLWAGGPPSSQMLGSASQQQLWLLPQQRPFNLLFPARSSGQGSAGAAGHPHTSLQKRRNDREKATQKEPFVRCGA